MIGGEPHHQRMTGGEPQDEPHDELPAEPAAVKVEQLTKRFGAVTACDRVDLELRRGRIHGILGENGAGKSTLMKMLIGLVLPDHGSISIDGRRMRIASPLDAASHGIAMVHQHLSLVDDLTVWENVALGDASFNRARTKARIAEIAEQYGLKIDPTARVGELPAGLRQRVELIKCLRRDPSILIFDEPTSVLTPEESVQLFESLRRVVTDEHRAVALVSHKLDEILHATDDVTIMRQGAVVARMRTADADAATLARAMLGRPVSLRSERAALGVMDTSLQGTEVPSGAADELEPVLEIVNASVCGRDGRPMLDSLNVVVRPGEIVGVAGVEGNGQEELVEVLSSLLRLDEGEVRVGGAAIRTGHAGAMADAGVAVIPADRHDSGIVLDLTVAENLVLVDPAGAATAGVLSRSKVKERAERLIDEFEIQCWGPDAPMWSLSGGNQQRVILGRELSHNPAVLVAAQPTRGLDVGAIEYMTGRLARAAEDGVGVLLISSEIEEILDLANRIVVLSRGTSIGEMARDDVDAERLGLLLGGRAA